MLDIFIQFIMELVRAVLIEALYSHVREHARRLLAHRPAPSCHGAIFAVHRRNRERLFNRLFTEEVAES